MTAKNDDNDNDNNDKLEAAATLLMTTRRSQKARLCERQRGPARIHLGPRLIARLSREIDFSPGRRGKHVRHSAAFARRRKYRLGRCTGSGTQSTLSTVLFCTSADSLSVSPTPVCIRTHKNVVRTFKILYVVHVRVRSMTETTKTLHTGKKQKETG